MGQQEAKPKLIFLNLVKRPLREMRVVKGTFGWKQVDGQW